MWEQRREVHLYGFREVHLYGFRLFDQRREIWGKVDKELEDEHPPLLHQLAGSANSPFKPRGPQLGGNLDRLNIKMFHIKVKNTTWAARTIITQTLTKGIIKVSYAC